MGRVTLRGLLAHKVRLALTSLAVVLGVAFVAGTFVLTDTLNQVFDDLFGAANKNIAAVVRGKAAYTSTTPVGAEHPPIRESLLAAVTDVPGVREARTDVSGFAQLVTSDGKAVTTTGAPTLGVSWGDSTVLSPVTALNGRGPRRPGEVAVDAVTAARHGIDVGERIQVVTKAGASRATVTGVFRFGTTGNLAGATLTAFDSATAQRLLLKPGYVSDIVVAADDGVSQAELVERLRPRLPADVEVITGKASADESAGALRQAMSYFSTFLLVFAGISLFVGAFLIVNTFSMLVAQRTRELALLRAVGASRRQVTATVLGEAAAVGLVGASVGLVAGIGLAQLMRAGMGAMGMPLPDGGLVVAPRTVAWAFALGIVVTVGAALAPARRAGHVPVMAALRDDVAHAPAPLRRRVAAGAALALGGGALGGAGLAGATGTPLVLVGVGAALVFVGVAALAPVLSRPVVRVVGAPLPRLFGIAGRLSNDNVLRDGRRTAATATALMIGLALVTGFSVLAASLKTSADTLIDRSVGGDFFVSGPGLTQFSPDLARRIARTPGVAQVTELRFGQARIDEAPVFLNAVTPEGIGQAIGLRLAEGSVEALGRGELLVDERVARERGWHVGGPVTVEFAATGPQRLRLGGTYRQNALADQFLIALSVHERNYVDSLDLAVLVTRAADARIGDVRRDVEAAAAAYPMVKVKDQTEFKAEQRRQIDQMLTLVFALLFLAIVIAVLGIVNTLALSVFERTREIGLLRAVGMSRRQVKRMVRLEAVTIALFGALLGLTVGTGFGWAVVRALREQGMESLTIPLGQLSSFVVVAALVGMLAALWPARRAARLDVLSAIAAE